MRKLVALVLVYCFLFSSGIITASAQTQDAVVGVDDKIAPVAVSDNINNFNEGVSSKNDIAYMSITSDFQTYYSDNSDLSVQLDIAAVNEYEFSKTYFSSTENIILESYVPKEVANSDKTANLNIKFAVNEDVVLKDPVLDFKDVSFESIYVTTYAYSGTEILETNFVKFSVLATNQGIYISEYGDVYAYDSYISYLYNNALITDEEYKYATKKITELSRVDESNSGVIIEKNTQFKIYNEKTNSVELSNAYIPIDTSVMNDAVTYAISPMSTSTSGSIIAPKLSVSRTINALDSGARLQVFGYVQWTDIDGNWHPARNIEVKIMDDNAVLDIAKATVRTNSNGYYTATFDNQTGIIENGLDIYIRVNTANDDFQIANNVANSIFSGGYYFTTEATQNVTSSQSIQYYSGSNSDAFRAVSVQQALVAGYYYYETMNNDDANTIEVIYPGILNSDGSEATWSNSFWDYLNIAYSDYCDWDVILHELGHQVATQINVDANFTESHILGENLSERYGKDLGIKGAWSEGWATYFSMAAQLYYNSRIATISNITNVADNIYIDLSFTSASTVYSGGAHDFTTYIGTSEGDELSVTTVLLSLLIDGDINLSHQTVWNIAKNSQCDCFSEFIYALYSNVNKSLHSEIGEHLEDQNIADSPIFNTSLYNRTQPATFTWNAASIRDGINGTTGSYNFNAYSYPNRLRITFYDKNLNIILQSSYINSSSTNASINDTQWKVLSDAISVGDPFYWGIETTQNSSPATGPYYSSIQKCYFVDDFTNITSLNTSYTGMLSSYGFKFYQFTAPESSYYTFYSEGSIDVRLTYYDYNTSIIEDKTRTDDDSGEGYNFLYRVFIPANKTVYLKVDGYSSAHGEYKIAVAKISDLTTTSVSGTLSGTTGIWYKFTAPYEGSYTFVTISDGDDTYGELFSYPTADGSTSNRLTWNDDSGEDRNFMIRYTLNKGQTVYLRVRGYSSMFTGTYDLLTYYPLTTDSVPNTYTLGYGGYYIYEFKAPEDGSYAFYTEGGTDTYIDVLSRLVYDISSVDGYIDYDDDSGEGNNCSVICNLVKDQIVYIRIKGYDTSEIGSYKMNAKKITDLTDNTPYSGTIAAGNGYWYSFTASASGTYRFFTTGETDTYGYLLDFYSSDYAANALAYNDDYGGTRNFSISYEMEAGETVYIYIRGYSASVTGAYTVFVE